MGCDSTTLKWVDDEQYKNDYLSAPGYRPQDPQQHGGPSIHGEKMWLVGAASDTLATTVLGKGDACCGRDNDSTGCGTCLLVQDPGAKHSDWTAIVMKKNRCPPESNGCEPGNLHLDIAVPGFDNLDVSTANICSLREGTGFANRKDSAILGDWYDQTTCAEGCSLADPVHIELCGRLPAEFVQGCKLFASWGWTSGAPTVRYKKVESPAKFVEGVEGLFNETGIVHGDGAPRAATTSLRGELEPLPASHVVGVLGSVAAVVAGLSCIIVICGKCSYR